jgi:hypothetical protein
MDRRSNYKNYELPGIYHITLKAAEALRSPFGKVVGKIDKPDGDPEAPSVALTPVGEMVEQELLHSISAHYPMVEVQDHIIMPEHMHFIVQVKRRIMNREGRSAHLGMIIAGYKLGCNHRWWKMTGQQMMREEPAAEPLDTRGVGARRFRRQGPHHIATLPSLFSEGYCDVMPIDEAQLEQQRAYIKGNPRSRLMRTSNRAWLQPQRGGINTALKLSALKGYLQRECAPSQLTPETLAALQHHLLLADGLIACDSYGNRKLLNQQCLPVVCHRKDARRLAQQQERCLDAAKAGAVLVSPRIAKGEQAIIDEAVNHGYPVILIADNGFPEVFHPSAERIERCANGQLLLVTPWEYHYRLKDEGITVAECKTMNCLAQALCRTADDWWKR